MKRLIIILTVLFTTVTAQAQEPNYKDWIKFIEKTWDCRAEIKQAGQFTGCSGFAIDYMHLMDADAQGNQWESMPDKYQKKLQKITGIEPGNLQPGQEQEVINGVMLVALDFMCESPEGKAWIVTEMAAGVKDETSMAGTLIALSMMNSIFCNQPTGTDYSKLFN